MLTLCYVDFVSLLFSVIVVNTVNFGVALELAIVAHSYVVSSAQSAVSEIAVSAVSTILGSLSFLAYFGSKIVHVTICAPIHLLMSVSSVTSGVKG
jgi:hypothetical protein